MIQYVLDDNPEIKEVEWSGWVVEERSILNLTLIEERLIITLTLTLTLISGFVEECSNIGLFLVYFWSIFGLFLVYFWSMSVRFLLYQKGYYEEYPRCNLDPNCRSILALSEGIMKNSHIWRLVLPNALFSDKATLHAPHRILTPNP